MSYHFQPMTPDHAHAIVEWRYPGEYAFYNMDEDPDDLREFLDNKAWEPDTKFSVTDNSGTLVGFFEFIRHEDMIEIGFGLRPDMTGNGHGESFVRAGLAFAVKRFNPRRVRVAVATFNKRAITVYERMGFSTTKTFVRATNRDLFEFVEMEREIATGQGASNAG